MNRQVWIIFRFRSNCFDLFSCCVSFNTIATTIYPRRFLLCSLWFSQLVARGDELEEIYKKIKIQRTYLMQGEKYFNEVCVKEKKLNITIHDLFGTYNGIQDDSSDLPLLKRQIYLLETDIFHEKSKIQALQNESEKSLNVHRWRKLQDSEPEKHAQILRIHELQKILIHKTETVRKRCDG